VFYQFTYNVPSTASSQGITVAISGAGSGYYNILPVSTGGGATTAATTALPTQVFNMNIINSPNVQGVIFNSINNLGALARTAAINNQGAGNPFGYAPETYSTFDAEVNAGPVLNFRQPFVQGQRTPVGAPAYSVTVPFGVQAVVVNVAFTAGATSVIGPSNSGIPQVFSLPNPLVGFVTPPIFLEPGRNTIIVRNGNVGTSGQTGFVTGDGDYVFEIIRAGISNIGVAVVGQSTGVAGDQSDNFKNGPGLNGVGSTILLQSFSGPGTYTLVVPFESEIVVPYVQGVGSQYNSAWGIAGGATFFPPQPVQVNFVPVAPQNPITAAAPGYSAAIGTNAATAIPQDNIFTIAGGPEGWTYTIRVVRQAKGIFVHNVPLYLCASTTYRFVGGINAKVTTIGTGGTPGLSANAGHTVVHTAPAHTNGVASSAGGVSYPDNTFTLVTGTADKFPLTVTYTAPTTAPVVAGGVSVGTSTTTHYWGGC